jgi:hypothetical protein
MSGPMNGRFLAVLTTGNERWGWWLDGFGCHGIPVISPVPHVGLFKGQARHFYTADVSAFSPDQLQRVASHLSRRVGVPIAEVLIDLLGEHGLPILAEDVQVVEEGVRPC